MRSRTLREGSVGLLILLGLAAFGGIFLWLRGISVGKRSYTAIVEFTDIAGMQEGAPVRYRGVQVGNITKIAPGSNGVEVSLDISPPDLKIPRQLVIEANQSGLIGETSIDIRPLNRVPIVGDAPDPFDADCEARKIVICNESRLKGQIGVSLYDLLRNSTTLAEAYSNPQFIGNLNSATQNAALAATEIAKLSREFTFLSNDLRRELRTFSASANSVASSANLTATQASVALSEVSRTANQFGNTATQANLALSDVSKTVNQFGNTAERFNIAANEIAITANKFGSTPDKLNETIGRFGNTSEQITNTLNRVGDTVAQYQGTAAKFSELATSLNTLIAENRTALNSTLNNFDRTSQELSSTLVLLRPTLNEFSTTFKQLNSGDIVKNLEALSANAAQTSANFRDLTSSFKDPKNAVLLQQTLDSARSTMQNLQKITSDVDELTGDPAFRDNLKNLVNGLGKLVSSSEELQKQVEVGQNLDRLDYQMKYTAARYPKFSPYVSAKPTVPNALE